MAKIKTVSLVAGISGRTCSLDDTHFATNSQTGKVYAIKVCNPADQSNPTERQQQVRDAFKANAAIVKAWRALNAPKSATDAGTEEYQAMMKQYKAQHKVGNWLAFVRTKIKDGAVPSFITTEGGASANPGNDDHTDEGGSF